MEVTRVLLEYSLAAGMCLPSRCLVINIYSNFTIPAFGRHVTIESFNCTLWEKFRVEGVKERGAHTNHWALKGYIRYTTKSSDAVGCAIEEFVSYVKSVMLRHWLTQLKKKRVV
jgi:hypothetical protein